MSMRQVKALMKRAKWGMLATTDGRRVGVRPMGAWAWVGAELWCGTGQPSDKVAQLMKVPHAEYCFIDDKGRHVRIDGPCKVSRVTADKAKLLKLVPGLRPYVESAVNPHYVVLRMRPKSIRLAGKTMTYKEVKLK